jgi:DNA-binding CsgD family transcriptional regulator
MAVAHDSLQSSPKGRDFVHATRDRNAIVTRPSHYNSRYKHDLSPQQRRVLDLLAEGRTNAEIAAALGLTLDGAKWHIREILGKLALESREDAAQWWREYQRAMPRAVRAVSGLVGLGIWKTTAVAGTVAVISVAAVAVAITFRAGTEVQSTALPACTAENMRWSAATERIGDTTRVTLSISLRSADWYEALLQSLRISDRHVDSPCLLDTEASVALYQLEEIPDAPPTLKPVPLVPVTAVERVSGSPGFVAVQAVLKTGQLTDVLVAALSNWCHSPGIFGAEISIPARRPGGPPMTGQSVTVPILDLPPCTDDTAPAKLTAVAPDEGAPPRP